VWWKPYRGWYGLIVSQSAQGEAGDGDADAPAARLSALRQLAAVAGSIEAMALVW
jgi:hypothetical protein